MIPTAQQVLEYARKLCHDTEIAGGQRYTNTYLREYAQSAWADLFQSYATHRLPRAQRRFYYILHPFTASLSPAALQMDIGDLQKIEERVVDPDLILKVSNVEVHTSKDAETVVDQCRITTTNQEHGFQDGDRVTIWGIGPQITDDINDQWMVRAVGDPEPYMFVLMGCTADETNTPPMPYSPPIDASILKSSQDFCEMTMDLDQGLKEIAAQTMGKYEWREGRIHFRGSQATLQLRLTMNVSPDFPVVTTRSLGIDGCFNFMSYAIASRALWQDDQATAKDYAVAAWGSPTMQPNLAEPGGHLQNFLRPQRRQQQGQPAIIRPGYGPPRRGKVQSLLGGARGIW